MHAASDNQTCLACGEARAVLVVIAGRRGEYFLCAKCAANPGAAQFTMAQRVTKTKKGKR